MQPATLCALVFGAALPLASLLAPIAKAEDGPPLELELELNAMDSVDAGCRLTFLAINQQEADLDKLVLETVLFTTEGRVDRLTLFDFGPLPLSRPRVRQFNLSDIACGDLGRILINGAQSCEGEGIAPGACVERLKLGSRTEAELIG
ncbi:MAG: hypothetical protein AAFY03_07365 [Pseudomonadota bacterium]